VARAVCPDDADLGAYSFSPGALSEARRTALAQHLEQCDLCRQEVAWFERLSAPVAMPDVEPRPTPAPAARRQRPSRVWVLSAATLLLALGAAAWYRLQGPAPTNPYAALIEFQELDYGEFADLRPEPPEQAAPYDEAIRLCQAGRYAEARAVLQKLAAALEEPHAGVEFLTGYTYHQAGQVRQAYGYYDRAEALDPKSEQRCQYVFFLSLLLQNVERAMAEVTEHPDDPYWEDLGRRVRQIKAG